MYRALLTNTISKLERKNLPIQTKRYFQAGKTNKNSVIDADSSKPLNKIYHSTGIVLAVLTPAAFILSPSFINYPIDLTLGILFPLHSHVALNYVITDYVPKSSRPLARGLVLAATIIAAAGILKLNMTGPGLTETIKSLWRKPTKKD